MVSCLGVVVFLLNMCFTVLSTPVHKNKEFAVEREREENAVGVALQDGIFLRGDEQRNLKIVRPTHSCELGHIDGLTDSQHNKHNQSIPSPVPDCFP